MPAINNQTLCTTHKKRKKTWTNKEIRWKYIWTVLIKGCNDGLCIKLHDCYRLPWKYKIASIHSDFAFFCNFCISSTVLYCIRGCQIITGEVFGLVWLSTVKKQLTFFHPLVRWIVPCTVCLLDKLNVVWICLKVTVRNWTSCCDRTTSVVSESIYFCITLHVFVKVSLYISYLSCIFITVYVFNIYTLLIISRFIAVLSSLSK